MSSSFKRFLVVSLSTILFMPQIAIGQSGKGGSPGEWDKTVELAKKEGRVVVSMPASPELRIAIEKSFEKRYGIVVEPLVGVSGPEQGRDALQEATHYDPSSGRRDIIATVRDHRSASIDNCFFPARVNA